MSKVYAVGDNNILVLNLATGQYPGNWVDPALSGKHYGAIYATDGANFSELLRVVDGAGVVLAPGVSVGLGLPLDGNAAVVVHPTGGE